MDWETDPRPFSEVLRAWGAEMGYTRPQQAAALCTPLTTLHGWHAGRLPANEAMVRRLMSLIAKHDRRAD